MKGSVNFPGTRSVVCELLMLSPPPQLNSLSLLFLCLAANAGMCLHVYFSPSLQNHWLRLNYSDGSWRDGGRRKGGLCFPGDISTPAELPGAAVTAPCVPPYGKGTVKALRLWNTAQGKKKKNTRRSPLSQITFHAQLFRWIIGATNKNGTL